MPLSTLFNNIATISKSSLLAQEVTADSSSNESMQDSDNKELTGGFNDSCTTELFDLLSTKAETHIRSQKLIKQTLNRCLKASKSFFRNF